MIKAKRKLREKLKKTANFLLIKCSLEKGDWAQILMVFVSFYTSQSGQLNRMKISEIDFKAFKKFYRNFQKFTCLKIAKTLKNLNEFFIPL